MATVVPPTHSLFEQHPPHELASHAHTLPTHSCPAPHEPAEHDPPHPSLAPHGWPAQLGVQPHMPACSAPQVRSAPHAVHASPASPHAELSVPGSQTLPEQHPEHDVVSHAHAPATQ